MLGTTTPPPSTGQDRGQGDSGSGGRLSRSDVREAGW